MMIHLIETPPGLMHRYGCPKAAAAVSITRWRTVSNVCRSTGMAGSLPLQIGGVGVVGLA